jgi:hypothetical protein
MASETTIRRRTAEGTLAPIEALGTEGHRKLRSVRRTSPAEIARACLFACDAADDEDAAAELVDAIVGHDPERRAAVVAAKAGLTSRRYAAQLLDRIVGREVTA